MTHLPQPGSNLRAAIKAGLLKGPSSPTDGATILLGSMALDKEGGMKFEGKEME